MGAAGLSTILEACSGPSSHLRRGVRLHAGPPARAQAPPRRSPCLRHGRRRPPGGARPARDPAGRDQRHPRTQPRAPVRRRLPPPAGLRPAALGARLDRRGARHAAAADLGRPRTRRQLRRARRAPPRVSGPRAGSDRDRRRARGCSAPARSARAHAELAVDLREVGLDGLAAHEHRGRDLRVRAPFGGERGDPRLGRAQLVRRRPRTPSRASSARARAAHSGAGSAVEDRDRARRARRGSRAAAWPAARARRRRSACARARADGLTVVRDERRSQALARAVEVAVRGEQQRAAACRQRERGRALGQVLELGVEPLGALVLAERDQRLDLVVDDLGVQAELDDALADELVGRRARATRRRPPGRPATARGSRARRGTRWRGRGRPSGRRRRARRAPSRRAASTCPRPASSSAAVAAHALRSCSVLAWRPSSRASRPNARACSQRPPRCSRSAR